MFFKKTDDDASTTAVKDDSLEVTKTATAAAPKGRPTPTRKEAEAARKATLKGGPPPGASKKETKAAEREQMRQQRIASRAAMMRGDERALPARDQGPVRKYVRDYIDSRRTVAEFFVPVAVVVLLLGLMRNTKLQAFVTLVWLVIILVVVTDTTLMLLRLNRQLKEKFPKKEDRKGVNFYATMRAMQIRRLRLPPPQFKAGGKPVLPKTPKQ